MNDTSGVAKGECGESSSEETSDEDSVDNDTDITKKHVAAATNPAEDNDDNSSGQSSSDDSSQASVKIEPSGNVGSSDASQETEASSDASSSDVSRSDRSSDGDSDTADETTSHATAVESLPVRDVSAGTKRLRPIAEETPAKKQRPIHESRLIVHVKGVSMPGDSARLQPRAAIPDIVKPARSYSTIDPLSGKHEESIPRSQKCQPSQHSGSDHGSLCDSDKENLLDNYHVSDHSSRRSDLCVSPITEPPLCEEQSNLVDLIMSGRNVFYTGSAGCGKSTVLKHFVKRLKAENKEVKIVTPTGRAALDVNGSTFWTFAGWTPDSMKNPLAELEKAAHGKKVWKRLTKTDVLVLDEVSMVENHHFERLDRIMKAARASDQPFGGIQLVVTGDFCQLPPVKPYRTCIDCGKLLQTIAGRSYRCTRHGDFQDVDKWAFRSDAWRGCNFVHVNLTTIHRQKDNAFIQILEQLRLGKPLSFEDRDLLLNHPSNTTNAVKLFSTREEVRRVNDAEFARLKTEISTFICLDDFRWNKAQSALKSKNLRDPDGCLLALDEHRYEKKLDLRVGMLVILLVNLDLSSGLANGSQGTVIEFRNDSGQEQLAAMQAGEYREHKKALIAKYVRQNKSSLWPVVRFQNGVERVIRPDCTINELGDEHPYSLLSRTQIPLIAAWAMTIHKSQGMTLSRVIVDLARSFEKGQAYVALSRARGLDGLKVEALGDLDQGGNEQVLEFLSEKFGVQ